MAEPLVVTGTGLTVDDAGVGYPTAVIDAAGRPDVTDLPRVHAMDGIGDLRTTITVGLDGLLLGVHMTSPVRSDFSVSFRLPGHLELLGAAADAGHLLLATSDPATAGDAPVWLAIDLDGARLRALLDQLDGGGTDDAST